MKLSVIIMRLLPLALMLSVAQAKNGAFYTYDPVPKYIESQFGPFGPQPRSYVPPAGAIYAAPDGKAANDGQSIDQPTTIKKAIAGASSGSVVVLRRGTYRTDQIEFNTDITIQAYLDEEPVIKGSLIAANWRPSGKYWITTWNHLAQLGKPGWANHDKTSGDLVLWQGDMLFVDGEAYTPVPGLEELGPDKFYIDYAAKKVYLQENPAGHTVEITACKTGLRRTNDEEADRKGPTLKGLTIMHYADTGLIVEGRVPSEAVSPGAWMDQAPHKTHVENCRFLSCGRINFLITSHHLYFGYNEVARSAYVGGEPKFCH